MESCLLGMETTESAPILCHNQAQAHLGKNLFDSTPGADVPGSGMAESPLSPTLHMAAVCVGEGVALPSGVPQGHLDLGVCMLEMSEPCAPGPRL